MEHNGMYPGDHIRIIKIVTYNNQFNGGLEYASVSERENINRYEQSPACHNVQTIWEYNAKATDRA